MPHFSQEIYIFPTSALITVITVVHALPVVLIIVVITTVEATPMRAMVDTMMDMAMIHTSMAMATLHMMNITEVSNFHLFDDKVIPIV